MERPFPTRLTHRWQALAAAGLLAIGAAAGTVAGHALQPPIEMAPMRPVPIAALPSQTGIVTIRARVAEIYGNKFIAQDATGRALVDLGRAGDRAALIASGQTVGVQGRYEHGLVRASFLVDAHGQVQAIGPAGGPPHHDRHGPPPPAGDGPHGADGPPPAPGA